MQNILEMVSVGGVGGVGGVGRIKKNRWFSFPLFPLFLPFPPLFEQTTFINRAILPPIPHSPVAELVEVHSLNRNLDTAN